MISIVAAVAKDNTIGVDGHLPWEIKEDLAFFKKLTMNHTVVMGRKTFDSLPAPLKGRNMIVASFHLQKIEGARVIKSFEEIQELLDSEEEVFIIGGASLYWRFIHQADKLYITHINKSFNGDAFFPDFNKSDFSQKILKDFKANEIPFTIVEYTRRK